MTLPAIARERPISVNSPGMRRILRVLEESAVPLTSHEIAERAFVEAKTFSKHYRHLLIDAGLAHIAKWCRGKRGPNVPAYRAGPGPDKEPKRPRKLTNGERCKTWRDKTGYDDNRRRLSQHRSALETQSPLLFLLERKTA